MADNTNKLSPCPFCGGDNIRFEDEDPPFYVHCFSCKADGPYSYELTPAFAAWNRRATPPALPASGEAREPLTDKQIDQIYAEHSGSYSGECVCEWVDSTAFARAIEAAHGIGGNAEGEAHGN